MTKLEEKTASLRHEAYSAATPMEVENFLLSLNSGGKNADVPVEIAADFRFLAYATLKRVSSVDPQKAYDILQNDLVPWCLKSYKRTKKADIHIYRSRELLGKWINEIPSEDLKCVLPRVFDTIVENLHGRTFKQACWTLGEIGYRNAALVERLRKIVAQHAGKAGDHALALIIILGQSLKDRIEYTREVIERFRLRKYYTTYYLLQAVASRSILNELEASFDEGKYPDINKRNYLLDIIARIANNLPDDPDGREQAAKFVRRIYDQDTNNIAPRLAIAGNLLPAIDSVLVGQIFSDLFLRLEGNPTERLHAIYVQSLRMRESTCPQQLNGLPAANSKAFEDFIHSVLMLEKESMGPNGSLFYDTKKGALWVALAIESTEALKWLPEILAHEPDGYVQQEIMNVYACFRLDPLPAKVRNWICETHDAKRTGDAENWVVRTSALRVARSAATEEAFHTLVSPGFTLDGIVLLDTVQALADTVLVLTEEESSRHKIAESLLHALYSSKTGPGHSAAVHALLALSRAGRLPASSHERLLAAAFEEGQEDFDQGRLLSTVISSGAPLSSSHMDKLERWAADRSDRVGESALESLIRINRLQLNGAIAQRLSIEENDGVFRWREDSQIMSKWAPFYIGLLYERSETLFLAPLLDVIRKGDWQQAAQIYGILIRLASVDEHGLTTELRLAIVERLSKNISSTHAEMGLFLTAACVAPEEFTSREWQKELDEWFADARIAFAESLRRSMRKKISDKAIRMGIKYLVRLAEDSQYGVRRSAFRALAEIDQSALYMMIHTWKGSLRHEARTWAAEAAGWITADFRDHDKVLELIEQLHLDVHKVVRNTIAKALTCRRQRMWAEMYLRRLEQLHKPSNAEMLAVWRYGWALARIGDDDTLDGLQRIRDDQERAPNLRHFAAILWKEAEKQWNETRKNWPDPIFPLKGRVETGAGTIIVDNKRWDVEYILWGEPAMHPDDYGRWGGNCQLKETPNSDKFFGKEGEIHTEDGRIGKGFVQHWSNLTELVFCGSGDYPS